jgi:hypothetical protein
MPDELDKLIDGALSTYSTAEPLAGLEQRILNRARARRARWPWLLAAVAVAAAILIAVQVRKPESTPFVALAPPPAPVVAPVMPARPLTPSRDRKGAVPHVARTLPKRQVFPTETPLTHEERLLVQLAESHPQELVIRPADQIEIKPIEIAPLQIDGRQ